MTTVIRWEFISQVGDGPSRTRMLQSKKVLRQSIEEHIENGWSFSCRLVTAQTPNTVGPNIDERPLRTPEAERAFLRDQGIDVFARTGRWRGPSCPLEMDEHWRRLETIGACTGCGRIHSALSEHGCKRTTKEQA